MSNPAYFIEGDPLFCSEKVKEITLSLEKTPGSVYCESISLAEVPFGNVLAKALNRPFFSAFQLFNLSECEQLQESDREVLASYLKSPAEFSALVFRAERSSDERGYDRPSKDMELLSALIQKYGGKVLRSNTPPLAAFIQEKMRRAGKNMDAALVRKLETEWRDFPEMLDSVLENLILFAGVESKITDEMAEGMEVASVKGDRFKFLDAVTENKTAEALILLGRLIENGDEPIALLSFLHGQIKLYWHALRLSESGLSEGEVFSELNISSQRAFFLSKKLKWYNRARTESMLAELFELDCGIKTGESEARSGLERWTTRSCRQRPASRYLLRAT